MSSPLPARTLRRLLAGPACLAALVALPALAQETNPENRATASSDEIIRMSPFEVTGATQKGYYGANTLSGTRFNAKLADLASSVTVMTKQQMTDFAMLDINDMFLYVAGTEGIGTYTDYTIDRNGSISDNVQANPTQANRVRGIGSANVSFDNIETMNRVPIDSLEVEAVEVSRGPNANVFGLGNPSGTVNLMPTVANLTRNRAATELRADSFGGYRTSLDVNQVLLRDKLAVRVSGIFQHDDFERQPSGVDTERYKAMVRYRPWKTTTITASVSGYHAYGNRPNTIPPRDNVSYWIASGKPTWDPVTMTVHVNGTTLGPYTAATYNGPDYFRSDYLGNNRNQMFIDRSGLVYWSAPQVTTNTTPLAGATTAGPTGGFTANHLLQTTAAVGSTFSGTAPRPFSQPLFNTTPTLNNRSIYDWSDINISAPNRFWDRTETYYIKVDQIFLDTQRQTLAAQAAFMREVSDRWARNLLGVSNDNGQSGQLTVDINERLIDGTVNPFFMRPYIASDKPRTQENPQKWDTTRGQVAYRLDLTKEDNLLKWLGWFQVTGYGEYKYRLNRQYSWRDTFASPLTWVAPGTYVGTQASPTGTPTHIEITQGEYRYYVGAANSVQVLHAPADFSYGTYPFIWVSRTGSGTTASPYVYTTHTENIALGQVAADKSGGNLNSRTTLKTAGIVGQSHLFGDRLVTTLGWRNDSTWTVFGNAGQPNTNQFLNSDGMTFNHDIIDHWATTVFKNTGHTTNVQFVLRPFLNTSLVTRLERNGGGGQFLGELLGGLSFYTNRSNSFLPTLPAQDLYRNLLPNTTGTEKSWGLGLSLFNDALQIRATRYDDIQHDAQTNDISTVAQRVLRVDFYPTGAGNPTPFLNLYTNATHWVQYSNPTWSADQIATEVQRQIGFSAADSAYYQNPVPPIGATTDVRSIGTEIEINYNPTHYWTVAASATKLDQSNNNISAALVRWIDERMPIWTTIVDPSITTANATAENNPGKLWWNHHYSVLPVAGQPASYAAAAQTPAQNYNAFVSAPFAVMRAQEGKTSPEIRPYSFRLSTSLQLAGISANKILQRMSVGGALRWEDKAAIGYMGIIGNPTGNPGIYTDLDPNRPIYDKTHYYVDLFATYRTKMLGDKVGVTFRFNVQNLGENGRLQPIGAFPDGVISTFRIVDPQKFIFTVSFDL
jgi:hypothetical protein